MKSTRRLKVVHRIVRKAKGENGDQMKRPPPKKSKKTMKGMAILLFALIPSNAFAQQPTVAPSHQLYAGPSLGTIWSGLCTASGASPQTCNATKGVVTTGTLTTAGASVTTYTINNSFVTANSVMSCDIGAYSGTFGTAGLPAIGACTPTAGTITVTIVNAHGSNALNGTIAIHFEIQD